ncbi:hypothetical protein DVG78_24430 [Runella aurantiaca]|uniref:Uncharacterized protein n=1 Tax=Runella aurantiaca TaxID=2282308 RepID=A0A369I736_9BACT|nr:hypothetical protein DVG78_24430 [Runella aurantiaca]
MGLSTIPTLRTLFPNDFERANGLLFYKSLSIFHYQSIRKMNNIFRGLLAGYGAKKLGGGCFSTVLIFIVLWYVLGQCS